MAPTATDRSTGQATVTVKFFATLRTVAGTKQTTVYGSTVTDLIAALTDRFGTQLRDALITADEPPQLRAAVKILVNGINIEHRDGLATPLEPGDTVAIFPPIGGG